MAESKFSRQYGFENAPEPLNDAELPVWVKDEIFYLMKRLGETEAQGQLFTDGLRHSIRPFLRQHTNVSANISATGDATWGVTRLILSTAEWNVAFDLCQMVYRVLLETYGERKASQLTLELNQVFDEAGVAWRMNGADFNRVMDSSTDASVAASQTALADSRFQAPKAQFNLAIKQFSERPEPNVRDCINNAIGSLEGVARVVTGKEKALSSLLNEEPLQSKMHPTLREAMQKVYAYRGAVTAHGQTGAQSNSYALEEAEWLMGMCATSISYIVKKFPVTTPTEEDAGIG